MKFDDTHVAAAVDFVVEQARTDPSTTYTAVFAAAGLPAPQELHGAEPGEVTRFMKALHDECIRLGYPGFDSLVVHASGPRAGLPGAGYFTVNGHPDPLDDRTPAERVTAAWQMWEEERQECYAFAR